MTNTLASRLTHTETHRPSESPGLGWLPTGKDQGQWIRRGGDRQSDRDRQTDSQTESMAGEDRGLVAAVG